MEDVAFSEYLNFIIATLFQFMKDFELFLQHNGIESFLMEHSYFYAPVFSRETLELYAITV